MSALHPISIVVFMFSLGQTTDMQDGGHLPRPSIFADPGNVLLRGISVVITCRSPAGFERFRLEKENLRIIDVINSSSSKTEARFYLGTVSKDTAGHYSCLYKIKNTWSPRSETLQLKVIQNITETSSPISEVTSGRKGSLPNVFHTDDNNRDFRQEMENGTPAVNKETKGWVNRARTPRTLTFSSSSSISSPVPTLQSYKVWNAVRMALSGVVLLVLGAIIGEAWHNQQKSSDISRTPREHNQVG